MSETKIKLDSDLSSLLCTGDWVISTVEGIRQQWQKITLSQLKLLVVDATSVTRIDSAGALLLQQILDDCYDQKVAVSDFLGTVKLKSMLSSLKKNTHNQNLEVPQVINHSWLFLLGRICFKKWHQCEGFLNLIGELYIRLMKAFFEWKRFHFSSIVNVVEHAGLRALPILALLAMLIGVVLTYQMGLQLKTYGVNIYIVYYCGIALQREFAPLITAIIVAGRTSSAFTAQLGSMKINEEIDAITTMGLAPTELLILPKILGLFFVFPLLIFWADIFGTIGSMLMSKFTLNVGYLEYIQYLKQSLGDKEYLLGLAKAPVFSLIIALVGCYQGFMVQGSANSVGFYTTKSVVQAIFLIIVADALFSFVYSWLGI